MKNNLLPDSSTAGGDDQITGRHLKLLRVWLGLRQYDIAAAAGIPATKLCEIESGRREASSELLERILEVIQGADSGNPQKR